MNFFRFAYERLLIFIYNHFSRENLFQVSIANTGTDVSKHPLVKKADIIHLHWINQGFLALSDIKKLTNTGKHIVWTMHDVWPTTGICHYVANSGSRPNVGAVSEQCINYMYKCGNCTLLSAPASNDLSHRIWKKKQFFADNIYFVGCSRWVADCARKSTLLKDAYITNIPNPIDMKMFHPIDKITARNKFNLPADKQLILFVAAKLSDLRKGVLYFLDACMQLADKNVEIVFLGGNIDENLLNEISLPIHLLGYLNKPDDISSAYSACDVFVTPSLSENLPNTIMEAMACGTPCVGFNVGGIPEMIDHKENGYVAEYKDAKDLARGILWTLYEADYDTLSQKAIRKVKTNYSEETVAKQYIDLYKSIVNDRVRK
jgi:glycosyltransferase involved in cell wall biosynthesis